MSERGEIKPSVESLVCELGVPVDQAPKIVNALYKAIGLDGDPVGFLNLKIQMKNGDKIGSDDQARKTGRPQKENGGG